MITNALAMGVPDVVNPKDITTGNVRVNTLFVSYIFRFSLLIWFLHT